MAIYVASPSGVFSEARISSLPTNLNSNDQVVYLCLYTRLLAWNIFSQHWLSGDVDIQLNNDNNNNIAVERPKGASSNIIRI